MKSKMAKRLLALILCAGLLLNRDMFALATVSSGDSGEVTSVDSDNTVTPGDADKTQIDIETAEDWEATLPTLTGVYADDVVAIAVNQLGYSQSKENVQTDGTGIVTGYYSRYGAWNETPYAEWDDLFVKFCISYAKIPVEKFPLADSAAEWIAALSSESYELYIPATVSVDEYEPYAGDLIFLNTDGIEGADQAGVIVAVTDTAYRIVLEVNGTVSEVSCERADSAIVGYGMLPMNVTGEGITLGAKSGHVDTHELDTDIPYPEKDLDDYKIESPTENDALKLNKVISKTEDANIFDLTLEAYGTGKRAEVTVVKPMDIVLVLDMSGSMTQSRYALTVTGESLTQEEFDEIYAGCIFYDYKVEKTPKESIPKLLEIVDGTVTVRSRTTYGQKVKCPNPITYCNDCGKWIKEIQEDVEVEGSIQTTYTYEEIDILKLYESGGLYETNMQATERALKEFAATVKAQGEANGVEHRIAIVSYGYYYQPSVSRRISNSNTVDTTALMTLKEWEPGLVYTFRTMYGNSKQDAVLKDNYKSYMQEAFMSVNSNEDWNRIDKAIWRYTDVLYSNSDTSTQYGMKMARDILKLRKETERAEESNSMVVVFADGAPGSGIKFYQNIANASQKYAKEIKELGTPIYVVGLYDYADEKDLGPNDGYMDDVYLDYEGKPYYGTSNRFFNYLSSNYDVELYEEVYDEDQDKYRYYSYNSGAGGSGKDAPDAVVKNDDGTDKVTKNSDGKQYFYSARDGAALAKAFDSIATSVEDQTTTTIMLDENTIMREQISQYFELEGDAHTCIEVYTQNWNGTSFGEKLQVYPGTSQDQDVSNITVTINGEKTIDVSGFSYKDFPVITEYDDNGNVVAGQGKQLVLKVKVETEEGFWGGNNVPTNEKPYTTSDQTGTAIYFKGEVVDGGVFPVPEANVPLHLDIIAEDKTVYYGADVEGIDLLTGITAGYKTVRTTEAKGKVTVNANGTLTPAESWMDDYASITWNTYADKTMASGTKLPTGAVSNKEYGDYLYKVTVAPKAAAKDNTSGHPGENEAGGAIAGEEVPTSGLSKEDTGYAYILVPKVEFQDSLIKLGYIPKVTDFEANNRVTRDADVQWVEMRTGTYSPETTQDNDSDTYPAVDVSTKPTLTYVYRPTDEKFSADTPVNVTVTSDKLDGKTGDITAVTTFQWKNCKESDIKEYHDEAVITTHKGDADSYEFWIHVRPTEVTVNKVWVDGGWYGDTYADRPTSIGVVLKQDGEVYKEATLKVAEGWTHTWSNLPICDANGNDYTYTVDEPTVPGGYEKSISGTTITNTLVKTEVPVEKQWTNEEGVTGSRPDSILVRLEKLENGRWEQVTNGATILADVSLNDENGWKHTFTQLPKKDASNEDITYRIREVRQESSSMTAVSDGELISGKNGWYYKVNYSDSNNNWIITNELQKTQLSLTKRINKKDAENATAIFRYLITGPNNYSANVTVNFEAGTVSGLETGTVKVNGTVMVTDDNVADNIGFDKDGLSVTISNLQPGTYKVIEYAARGYELVQQATTDQKAPEENVTAFSGVQKPLDVEATVAVPGKAYYWNRYNVPTDYTAVNRFSVDANGNLSISVDRKNN